MGLNGGLGTELGHGGQGPEAQRGRCARETGTAGGGGWKGPGFAQQQASPLSNLGAVT